MPALDAGTHAGPLVKALPGTPEPNRVGDRIKSGHDAAGAVPHTGPPRRCVEDFARLHLMAPCVRPRTKYLPPNRYTSSGGSAPISTAALITS